MILRVLLRQFDVLLLDEFNKANAKVAQLCNHQKNVGKSFKTQVDKIDEQVKNVRSKLRKAREGGKSKEEKVKDLEYMPDLKAFNFF